jgi:hypothetical protein
MASHDKPQSEKFKDAAKEHGADEDEKRWEERLKRVAKSQPDKPPKS